MEDVDAELETSLYVTLWLNFALHAMTSPFLQIIPLVTILVYASLFLV